MATDGTKKIIISGAVTIVVTAIAIMALTRIIAEVELNDVVAAIRDVTWLNASLALLATIGCYLALSGYDVIALKAIGRPLPWKTAAMASTSAYALSHNLGFAALTSTWARHRVYATKGVGLPDVTRVVLLTGASFWMGVLLMLGVCLVFVPDAGKALPQVERQAQIAIGFGIIGIVIAYLLAIMAGMKKIGWRHWSVPLPNLKNALFQCGISLIEMTLSALVLWFLIPGIGADVYPIILVAYVTAFVAVLITHAPGGAGVLEAIVILMVPDIDPARLLGALILFRLIFHILPLGVGIAILIVHKRR